MSDADEMLHAVCHMNMERLQAEQREWRAEALASLSADAIAGGALYRLLRDNVRRKTYRREELQALLDAADARVANRHGGA